jgi:PAS domain-containing protein
MPEDVGYLEGIEARELYRTIVDEVEDGVYVLDTRRRIVLWNRGAERITGFSSGEVVGRSCAENILVHLDSSAQPLCSTSCPALSSMRERYPAKATCTCTTRPDTASRYIPGSRL